jgi:hypothetical protein
LHEVARFQNVAIDRSFNGNVTNSCWSNRDNSGAVGVVFAHAEIFFFYVADVTEMMVLLCDWIVALHTSVCIYIFELKSVTLFERV